MHLVLGVVVATAVALALHSNMASPNQIGDRLIFCSLGLITYLLKSWFHTSDISSTGTPFSSGKKKTDENDKDSRSNIDPVVMTANSRDALLSIVLKINGA
ncbi:hypothetical protein BVC80_1805g67 [Macleaya cordata]|uniref:Uncharacterized protein n=1 Tax=Macleaya cordata TaxID=56857 RepID=A0A200QQW6_MACCD|nr:hypothetical protein BVC80_1805g67 [Macleaya cordata]